MNSKQFLIIAGALAIILGLLGFFGVFGPTPTDSIFGDTWYFDNFENWALVIVGVVSLVLAFSVPAVAQKWITVGLGTLGVLLGVYSIFTPALLGANLENPTDTTLLLLVGVWGLLAAFLGRTSAAANQS